MAHINSVMLIGRLTADPQTRNDCPDCPGERVCVFPLAVTERAGDGRNRRFPVEVEARRQLGAICARYLRKGSEVFVVGRLRLGARRRSSLTVQARQVQFLGPRSPKPSLTN